ncbi:ABC transporter permease [Actinophytocola xinjiangensis]|uniref:ABC transporter permease n=1 Tax=Actinophytocola xinjiangensis TaxID=485602 RepID=A0A7Z1B0H8_9PSEU|nr:ABC-2 family transporter protein [Actinophytocola xinjiangensis]OLF12669.1 ABC transporter permease [Actinophytocola xinjiangensis]
MVEPYLRLLVAQVRGQTQYRASFVVELVFSTLMTALDVVTVFVIFSVNDRLGGFGGTEVLMIVGIAAFGFPAADLVVGNVERLRVYVRTGLLDAVLVRPLSALGQLVAMDFSVRRAGRVVQGTALYVVALVVAPVVWSPGAVVLVVLAPLSATVFFGAIFVVGATVAFWWIESGEIANAFTYGGRDFTSYPMTVFSGLFRRVFAYGLGFAFVAYLPALALLGRSDPIGAPDWLRWCSPLVALFAAGVAALFWRTGIRHYRSTGS